MERKFALIVGNDQFEDPSLARLVSPASEAHALAEILKTPGIGGFDEVTALVNEPEMRVRREIASLFSRKKPDDLLLLYFSGHGLLDENGRLFLAARDTQRDLLKATSIASTFVTDEMDNSSSRRQVLILDCCHSGAFARGTKGVLGASVSTAAAFEGNGFGRWVLTATDSTQYAWDGDKVIGGTETPRSVFTRHLIEGLRTGEADGDDDGRITLDELYEYIYQQVLSETPRQTPNKWSYKQQGNLSIACNPYSGRKIASLPDHIQKALESDFPSTREGAIRDIKRYLHGSQAGLAKAAEQALKKIVAEDDSRKVQQLAAAILEDFCKDVGAKPLRASDPKTNPPTETEAGSERVAGLRYSSKRTIELDREIPLSPINTQAPPPRGSTPSLSPNTNEKRFFIKPLWTLEKPSPQSQETSQSTAPSPSDKMGVGVVLMLFFFLIAVYTIYIIVKYSS